MGVFQQMNKEQRGMLLSAAAMIVIIAMLIGYSGYAWFTMSKTVRATGVDLTADTSDGLEISTDNTTWSEKVVIDLEDIVQNSVAGYNKATNSFYLLPASSYSGFDNEIFATGRAKLDGTAYEDTVFSQGHAISGTSTSYEGHFIDVPLYFRTSNDNDLKLKLALTINGTNATTITPLEIGSKIEKTVRVAFMNQGKNAPSYANTGTPTPPLVYALDRGDGEAFPAWVVTQAAYPTSPDDRVAPRYMQFTDNLSNDILLNVPAADYSSGSITYNSTSLVVRIWIEGQDSLCVTALGNKSFSLNLGFEAVE